MYAAAVASSSAASATRGHWAISHRRSIFIWGALRGWGARAAPGRWRRPVLVFMTSRFGTPSKTSVTNGEGQRDGRRRTASRMTADAADDRVDVAVAGPHAQPDEVEVCRRRARTAARLAASLPVVNISAV